MPVEIGVWRIDGGAPKRLQWSAMETEAKLEKVLVQDITLLDSELFLVGSQVPTAYGTFIDILAVDSSGDLTVVELKRARTPREVIAQVLDYGSWIQTLGYSDITTIYARQYPGKRFEEAFAERFQADPPEELNSSHRLLIVASELDQATERIVNYLTTFGVPANVAFFRYFKDNGGDYLARTWLIDPTQAETQVNRNTTKVGKEPWNGRDFYVALGEDEHRNWEDCRHYGFVAAGQGRRASAKLEMLSTGARVFACIPQRGYVGVGVVKGPATRVREFTVTLPEGKSIPLLEAPLSAPAMGANADDVELSEYVVPVDWKYTVAARDAFWEKGMFANQNIVCRLRNQFTLERLYSHFGLSEESSEA